MKKKNPDTNSSDDGNREGQAGRTKAFKKAEPNNIDKNFGNLIDDSKEVRIHSKKIDPSFDQGSYAPNKQLGDLDPYPFADHDVSIPMEEDEIDDARDVQSDEGPDRINLQELEEKIGGFEEFKELVASTKAVNAAPRAIKQEPLSKKQAQNLKEEKAKNKKKGNRGVADKKTEQTLRSQA